MKNIVYILFLLTNLTFGQTSKLTVAEIEKYSNAVDKMRENNSLVKVTYENKSYCGGWLRGYYQDKKLVFIDSKNSAELGYSAKSYYIKNNQRIKIIYTEHFAEWGKYEENYPPDKYEWDETKMTYTDTVYTILLSSQTIFNKKSENKIIDNKQDKVLIDELLKCGNEMTEELYETIKQVDSLKFVKEMPYICETGICGDKLYWEAVSIGRINIELLIDKLDDTTSTTANVVLFGGNYTVADIAYSVLSEIIHDIPTFDILGVPFDKDGCGYCSYWQHLNKDFANRQKFKEAVKNWFHKNKDNLVWVESNNFATCDCNGNHPNGGHYELKTDTK